MKFAIVVLSTAMLCQVSLAGVLERFRRDTAADGLESTLALMKRLAGVTGPLVTSVLKEVPKSDNYAPYRQELQEYLEGFNEYKEKKGLCFQKSSDLLEKFAGIVEKYEKEDAPEEAKKIDELFNSYNSEELEKEIDEYVKKMDAMSDQNSNEIDEATVGFQLLERHSLNWARGFPAQANLKTTRQIRKLRRSQPAVRLRSRGGIP
ncbi:uncharacterized protein LOC106081640 [Stomoxys calcitrans]|uniref:uncharacterized protein LOC106081640 n=1 Tax=Stomoxys calcitrans TaxID=35570 RepID=UPI0027E247A4|nr:uncharacterized protein LOC106081640 [Stomoxys calcitrans]